MSYLETIGIPSLLSTVQLLFRLSKFTQYHLVSYDYNISRMVTKISTENIDIGRVIHHSYATALFDMPGAELCGLILANAIFFLCVSVFPSQEITVGSKWPSILSMLCRCSRDIWSAPVLWEIILRPTKSFLLRLNQTCCGVDIPTLFSVVFVLS